MSITKPRKTRRLKYGSQRDKALRKEVWKRDQGRCQGPYCRNKPPYSLQNLYHEYDHRIPLSKGGSNKASNVRLLCPMCHALRKDDSHNGLRRLLISQKRLPKTGWESYLWEG